jgi:hypothetical protein
MHESLKPTDSLTVQEFADICGGLLGREFVVSGAGEAYDARARGSNPNFRMKRT